MVERLIGAILVAAPAFAGAALAQTALTDPTRPPNASATMGDAAPAGGSASAPRLQSVLISPQRRLAVIDGRVVPLGGLVAGATLVQVAETHVTLQSGGEVRVLELYPGVVRKAPAQTGTKKKKGTL